MKLPGIALLGSLVLLSGCQHHQPWEAFEKCRDTLPVESRQAVVVAREEASPSGVALRLYERGSNGWQPLGGTIAAVAGSNGLAPAGEKREGDGRTPSGVFTLERGFGYEPFPTKLPYLVLTPEMIWIDDPRSGRYNTLAEKREGEGLSYEIMRRADDLYKYGIVVEYNTSGTIPGAGSAIFFHIWRSPATPTAGCIAVAEPDIVQMLRWLDPVYHPLAVIGDACR
jgi:L,D-peptidoglycan transpeptidase YkuD (ErfK/YbiS/YcfS/YnhG family)